jgi:hypothetical protein
MWMINLSLAIKNSSRPTKRTHHLLVVCCLLYLPFLSCTPLVPGCKPDVDVECNISEATKAKLPYRSDGKDTLTYFRKNGDTAVLYGVGVEVKRLVNGFDWSPNPNCIEMHRFHYEVRIYRFAGINDNFRSLTFYLYYRIDVDNNLHEIGNFTAYDDDQNYSFMNGPGDGYTETDYFNDEKNYDHPVTIKNKVYNGCSIASLSDFSVIYNYKYGALSVMCDGREWFKLIE